MRLGGSRKGNVDTRLKGKHRPREATFHSGYGIVVRSVCGEDGAEVLEKVPAMSLTVTIPEEFADDIRPFEHSIPEILQKEISARESCDDPVYVGFSDVLETLVRRPTPDVVLALRPSSALQARLDELLEKNRTTRLTPDEWRELNRYTYLNHLVRIAKAEAAIALKPQP